MGLGMIVGSFVNLAIILLLVNAQFTNQIPYEFLPMALSLLITCMAMSWVFVYFSIKESLSKNC